MQTESVLQIPRDRQILLDWVKQKREFEIQYEEQTEWWPCGRFSEWPYWRYPTGTYRLKGQQPK